MRVRQMKLNHLAIIMDGNRRWARMRTLQAVAGYDMGAQTLEDIASALASYDVSYLTVFAFSAEKLAAFQSGGQRPFGYYAQIFAYQNRQVDRR